MTLVICRIFLRGDHISTTPVNIFHVGIFKLSCVFVVVFVLFCFVLLHSSFVILGM